ncbi:protein CpxP [Oxalobacteraceae bacterium GrIS 1.11]
MTTMRHLFLAAILTLPALAQADAPADAPGLPAMHDMPHPHAAPPPFERGERGAPPPFLRGITLSEAQQDKVFAVMHAQEPLLRDQRKIVSQAHEELHALAASGKFDDAKAGALAQTIGQAMARITLQQARSEQELMAMLTAEQRKQAEQHEQDGRRRP